MKPHTLLAATLIIGTLGGGIALLETNARIDQLERLVALQADNTHNLIATVRTMESNMIDLAAVSNQSVTHIKSMIAVQEKQLEIITLLRR